MKVVGLEIERGQLRVGDLDASRVVAAIEFGSNLQACASRCVGDQLDDHFVTHQRPTSPVLGDVREHAMLDLVPLAGPGREVAHLDGQPEAGRQALQGDLPQTAPTAIASPAVGGDQQRPGVGIAFAAHLLPPAADGLHRELRGVVIDARTRRADGTTQLRYHLRCVEDLHGMLKKHGDWMSLGGADEQKPAAAGTVEAWGRSPTNPVSDWYGLKKGLRGRFGVYVPPVLEVLGLAEVEHNTRNNRMRAK